MANVQFNYLYRDAWNYKNHGDVIFNNPTDIDLSALTQLIESKLIDGTWFYAHQWQVPDLHFGNWDSDADHTFHEFDSVTYTTQPSNSLLNLADFITIVLATKV